MRVYQKCLAERYGNIGMLRKDLRFRCQAVLHQDVVLAEKMNDRSGGLSEQVIQGLKEAAICPKTGYFYARVGKGAYNLPGTVDGSVICNEQLETGVALPEHRGDALFQKPLSVIN